MKKLELGKDERIIGQYDLYKTLQLKSITVMFFYVIQPIILSIILNKI